MWEFIHSQHPAVGLLLTGLIVVVALAVFVAVLFVGVIVAALVNTYAPWLVFVLLLAVAALILYSVTGPSY